MMKKYIQLFKIFVSWLITGSLLCGLSGCVMETNTSDLTYEVSQEIKPFTDETLAAKVNQLIQNHQMDPENLGIVIENFDTGQTYSLNEYRQFTAASLYKLPLAMIYYEAIGNGLDDLSELEFLPEYYEDAGWLSGDYAIYSWVPIRELLSYAIVFSDNNAGHILFENLGGWENYVVQRQKYYRDITDTSKEESTAGNSAAQDGSKEEVTLYEAEIEVEDAENSDEDVETEIYQIQPSESESSDDELILVEDAENSLQEGETGIYEIEVVESEPSKNELVLQNRLVELENARNLENTMSPLFMSDCLYYIYQNEKAFSKLISDLSKAQPETYLNTSLNGYYAQKYGAYGSVLNIAGYHSGNADYSIVVMSENEVATEYFMNDLGQLVREYFEASGSESEK